jgi:alanine dehydrogenase
MRIGIPREIKTLEGRVALVPAAVGELVAHGHEVFIERKAGMLSGYADEDYQAVGANLKPTANDLYEAAELIVKVKEPIEPEFSLLRPDHLLFCYLHLAALPELTAVLQGKGLTAVGWETVSENGRLPLLVPMSDIAGRLAVQIASNLLQHINGGSGVLLGGLPAADRAHVVIIGPGTVGTSAATVGTKHHRVAIIRPIDRRDRTYRRCLDRCDPDARRSGNYGGIECACATYATRQRHH